MALTPVTEASFQKDVLEEEGAVLVDFWATWCGPCRVVHPILEEIDAERDDLKIVSLDIDTNAAIAGRYDVLSIPTMILFKNGQMVDRLVGSMPKRKLLKQLEPLLAA